MGKQTGAARDALLKDRLRQRARREIGAEPAEVVAAPTEPVPLSPFQRPLWIDYQMYPERRTAWIIRGYELDGAVDSGRLSRALASLKQRHWYLSCAIDSDGLVHPREADIPLDVFKAGADPWQDAQIYCRTHMPPFRLEQGELFRVALFEGDQQSAIVFSMHHIIADHRSVDLITDELSAVFADDVPRISRPTDLVQAYARQRSALNSNLSECQRFWRSQLDGLPAVKPLPLAKPLVDSTQRKGALLRRSIDGELAAQCRAAAQDAGVSAYQWFLSAWSILLARYYGTTDVHLGTMFSTRMGSQQNAAIGCFQNVVIVRADLDSTESFLDVVREMRSVIGKAVAHGTLPLDELTRIAPLHPGSGQLFSTLFTLVETHDQERLLNTEVLRAEELDYDGTAFDLTFFVVTSGKDLSFAIEFDTGIYEKETLAVLFDHFQVLLRQMATAPDTGWRRCSLIESKGLAKLEADWRQIAAAPLPKAHLHDAFYEHARANPDAVALKWGSGTQSEQMTYQDLASRADAVAGFIHSVGSASDTLVAVIGSWQPDTVAAIIGILRSGRAYLPIDADYPESRKAHILRDAEMPLVLLQEDVKAPDGCLDRCHSVADAIEAGRTLGAAIENPVAYVIYTSGSSGDPKGVHVSHGAAVYSTAERNSVYADWRPEKFLLLSSFAFDSAIAGFWWTLSEGGCLRLVQRRTVRAADELADLIRREDITHTLCLPSQWADICRISRHPLDSMKLAIVAGEACTGGTIRCHFEYAAGAALYNEYGPTEMTVWSTFHQLQPGDDDPVPIGLPLPLTQALVIDEFGNVVPDGFSGELVLAGQGIAEGYTGNVGGGFTAHPLDPGSRAYKTGDRAQRGADGFLYFEGRVDEQVKYRGYRIGIESIEQVLGASGGEVAVIPWDGTTLEDLLARLPEDQAHALLDRRLERKDDSAQLRQGVSKD